MMLNIINRLGQPYLFLHSGNCEHLIQFTDLRLMTKDDEQVSELFNEYYEIVRWKRFNVIDYRMNQSIR